LSQEDVMRILDENKGLFLSIKEVKQLLNKRLTRRSVGRALNQLISMKEYELQYFFDRSNTTSTNAIKKYRAKP